MPGGAQRTALRATAETVMDNIARLSAVPHRDVMAMRPTTDTLPERMVAIAVERPTVADTSGGINRPMQMVVIIRRKGAAAQDELDMDQDAVEPALIAAIEVGSTTCEITETRFDFPGESDVPFAQMTMTFAVTVYD